VLRGRVLAAGVFVWAGVLGVVRVGGVLVELVELVEVVELVDLVEVVVVLLEPPDGGAAVPPVGNPASATGADSASIAAASARCGNICLGEVIKTKPVLSAPQLDLEHARILGVAVAALPPVA
jgi:hypothetical protein